MIAIKSIFLEYEEATAFDNVFSFFQRKLSVLS